MASGLGKVGGGSLFTTLLCMLLLLIVVACYGLLPPLIQPIAIRDAHGHVQVDVLPYYFPESETELKGSFELEVAPYYPSDYHLWLSESLKELRINGHKIDFAQHLSTYGPNRNAPLRLKDSLIVGVNHVEFVLRPVRIRRVFDLRPIPYEGALGIIHLIKVLALCVLSYVFLTRAKWCAPLRPLVPILLYGVALRFIYAALVPPTYHWYDDNDHMEYIRRLVSEWTLPMWDQGVELHQAPLYYILMALPLRLFQVPASEVVYYYSVFREVSIYFSVAALFITALLFERLFRDSESRWLLRLATMLLATLPVAVVFGTRIGNDVLLAVLTPLAILLLVRWSESPRVRLWHEAMIASGAALLTKISFLMNLAPALFLMLVSRSKRGLRARWSVLAVLDLSLLFGWYVIWRFMQAHEHFSILGASHTAAPMLDTNIWSFITFNPLRIIHSHSDSFLVNQYLWEYLFRTTFFAGDINLYPATIWCTAITTWLGSLAFVLMLIGFLAEVARGNFMRRVLVAIVLLNIVLVGLYRFFHPYHFLQDVRLIPLFLVLIPYYTIRGAAVFPRVLQLPLRGALYLLVAACSVSLVAMAVTA